MDHFVFKRKNIKKKEREKEKPRARGKKRMRSRRRGVKIHDKNDHIEINVSEGTSIFF